MKLKKESNVTNSSAARVMLSSLNMVVVLSVCYFLLFWWQVSFCYFVRIKVDVTPLVMKIQFDVVKQKVRVMNSSNLVPTEQRHLQVQVLLIYWHW
jgi:hypothetical protein